MFFCWTNVRSVFNYTEINEFVKRCFVYFSDFFVFLRILGCFIPGAVKDKSVPVQVHCVCFGPAEYAGCTVHETPSRSFQCDMVFRRLLSAACFTASHELRWNECDEAVSGRRESRRGLGPADRAPSFFCCGTLFFHASLRQPPAGADHIMTSSAWKFPLHHSFLNNFPYFFFFPLTTEVFYCIIRLYFRRVDVVRKVYTSIDIGSDTIKFIVGENLNNQVKVLSFKSF